jgi:hypothetical protein
MAYIDVEVERRAPDQPTHSWYRVVLGCHFYPTAASQVPDNARAVLIETGSSESSAIELLQSRHIQLREIADLCQRRGIPVFSAEPHYYARNYPNKNGVEHLTTADNAATSRNLAQVEYLLHHGTPEQRAEARDVINALSVGASTDRFGPEHPYYESVVRRARKSQSQDYGMDLTRNKMFAHRAYVVDRIVPLWDKTFRQGERPRPVVLVVGTLHFEVERDLQTHPHQRFMDLDNPATYGLYTRERITDLSFSRFDQGSQRWQTTPLSDPFFQRIPSIYG